MIDSEAIAVEAFRINEKGEWVLKEYRLVDQELQVPTLQLSIPLRDMYEGTKLLQQ